jgi:predicted glutamine amidotransferase
MCDIFAISAGYNYTPQEYLPIFAEKGKQNMNGWGIGFFRNGQAFVEKSSDQVFSGDQVHKSFQRLARVIDSRIVVSHICCPLSGGHHSIDNHPFSLSFLNHVWLFVHVGRVQDIENYQTVNVPRVEAEVYPARIFEYLRDQLVSLLEKNPYASLYGALGASVGKLLSDYPGYYTFFLANESVLFAFCNFGQLMVLRESKTLGDILLVTSIGDVKDLSPKEWLSVRPEEDSPAKILVVAGPDVLYSGDI